MKNPLKKHFSFYAMVFQFLYKPDLRQPRVTLGQVVSVHNCPS